MIAFFCILIWQVWRIILGVMQPSMLLIYRLRAEGTRQSGSARLNAPLWEGW